MSRSVRHVVNFFAFNLLFFSLYLNFIHKDKADGMGEKKSITEQRQQEHTPAAASPETGKELKQTGRVVKLSE